jgi:hypothetical protein
LWYELFDHGDDADQGDAENWFGLVNGGGLAEGKFVKRKGAAAYQLCALNIPGTEIKTPQRSGLPESVQAYYFEGPDGRRALVVWSEIVINPRTVGVSLPGINQKAYDLSTGEAKPIPSFSTWTLKSPDQVNHFIQFFTWENAYTTQQPLISAY